MESNKKNYIIITAKGEQWEAYDPLSGERALASTKEDAKEKVEQKIHMSNVLQEEQKKPLSNDQLEECRKKIVRDIIKIWYDLKKNKVIMANNYGMGVSFMINHRDILEEELKKMEYDSKIDCTYVFQGIMPQYAIYNSKSTTMGEAEEAIKQFLIKKKNNKI